MATAKKRLVTFKELQAYGIPPRVQSGGFFYSPSVKGPRFAWAGRTRPSPLCAHPRRFRCLMLRPKPDVPLGSGLRPLETLPELRKHLRRRKIVTQSRPYTRATLKRLYVSSAWGGIARRVRRAQESCTMPPTRVPTQHGTRTREPFSSDRSQGASSAGLHALQEHTRGQGHSGSLRAASGRPQMQTSG